MCFEDIGVTSFRNYLFKHDTWSKKKQNKFTEIKPSHIPNAGNGLFARKMLKPGTHLLYTEGEPLEPWYYHALDIQNQMYSGVNVHFPRIGKFVWRIIPNTLGCAINCAKKERDANVEFVLHWKAINHSSKIIDGNQLVSVYVKKDKLIQKGDELLVFYGHEFWQHFNKQEMYCAICLEGDSTFFNPLFLCDGTCGYGYHKKCLKKWNIKPPMRDNLIWFCMNCS
jgi:hypothetical protein